jgi:Bacterial PH domain
VQFVVVEPRVIRSRAWNALGAGILVAIAASCAGIMVVVDAPTVNRTLCFAVSGLPLAVGAARAWTAGVIVAPDGLVVRELFYTKRLPWAVVRGARVAPKGTNPGSPIDSLIIDYAVEPDEDNEGLSELVRPLTVTVLGAYRRAVVQQRSDELNELIQQYRPRA